MTVGSVGPKVSIVMPVYNGGNYFELALKSAIAQTYTNTEIIIVNDGSTDDGATDEIGRRYAAADPARIRYFHQSNTGVAGALNKAVQELTGDIFCWLSHDDLYAPEKTAVQVEFWQKLAKPDAMLISNYTLIDPEGKQFADVRFDHQQFANALKIPLYRGAVNGCTIFVPVSLLRAIPGPFNVALRFTQDFDLWRQLIRITDFYHVPQSLVHYRVHPGQDSARPDILDENERLWRAMVDETTEVTRVQMYGSSLRFYEETYKILEHTKFSNVCQHLLDKQRDVVAETLVSVIIPFFNEIALVRRALASVLGQTHRNLEVLLIDDGSSEPLTELEADVAADPRAQLFSIPNGGPGAARNFGLRRARGAYMAFLDADDIFLPSKIEIQLGRMMTEGVVASHTSYLVTEAGSKEAGVVESGRTSGNLYPDILANCPMATPTVMLSRVVIEEGLEFSDTSLVEDVGVWVEISVRYPILGLNEPLTVVERDDATASGSVDKGILGLQTLIRRYEQSPLHSRQAAALADLRGALELLLSKKASGVSRVPLYQGSEEKRQAHHVRLMEEYARFVDTDVSTALPFLTWANALHPTGDTLTALAVHHRLRGEHQMSLELFDQVFALLGPNVSSSQRYARAISYCYCGRPKEALEDARAAWAMKPDDQGLSYGLASLLAFDRQFDEAARLFERPLQVPLGNGGATLTSIVSFEEPDPTPWLAPERLHKRAVSIDLPAVAECFREVDLVFFICCDSKYFELFAEAVARSIAKNAGMAAGLHVHIVNPSDGTDEKIDQIRGRVSIPFSSSTETIELSSLGEDQRRTYYASSRFLVLPTLLEAVGKPVIMTDADQVVVRSVTPLLSDVEGSDVGLLVFPHAAFNFISLVSASVVYAGPTPASIGFYTKVATYLASALVDPAKMLWHLDQAALAVAFVTETSAKVFQLPHTTMHSQVFDGKDVDTGDAIFWSVTYSIPANKAKLDTDFFVSLATG